MSYRITFCGTILHSPLRFRLDDTLDYDGSLVIADVAATELTGLQLSHFDIWERPSSSRSRRSRSRIKWFKLNHFLPSLNRHAVEDTRAASAKLLPRGLNPFFWGRTPDRARYSR
jgi:hypothetical protein